MQTALGTSNFEVAALQTCHCLRLRWQSLPHTQYGIVVHVVIWSMYTHSSVTQLCVFVWSLWAVTSSKTKNTEQHFFNHLFPSNSGPGLAQLIFYFANETRQEKKKKKKKKNNYNNNNNACVLRFWCVRMHKSVNGEWSNILDLKYCKSGNFSAYYKL